MLRTTSAAGRIRDESLMNLGGRGKVKSNSVKITVTQTFFVADGIIFET
jgi:hypothetical protein